MLLHFCRFFIFIKLTIESRNIELFCTQFNSRVYSLIHIILMFFYVERQPEILH
jgi:hypothetical protein